jgi:hypothetical protein
VKRTRLDERCVFALLPASYVYGYTESARVSIHFDEYVVDNRQQAEQSQQEGKLHTLD